MSFWSRYWPAKESLRASDSIRLLEDVRYAPDHPKQTFDLCLPTHVSEGPVVLFVHGGVWKTMDKRMMRGWTGLYTNVGMALARCGIATAVTGYRQHPTVDSHGSLEDLRRAMDGLLSASAKEGFHATKRVLFGHSGGAHLVTCLALDGFSIDAVIACSGFYHLGRLESWVKPSLHKTLRTLFPREQKAEDRWSPLLRIAKRPIAAPFFVAAGEKEDAFLVQECDAFVQALQEANQPHLVWKQPREGHMSMIVQMATSRDALTPRLAAFLLASDQ